MRNSVFYILIYLICSKPQLYAQKEDNSWVLGGGYGSIDSVNKTCHLGFGDLGLIFTFSNTELPFTRTNAVLSDPSGNLLCASNGENLYNRNFAVIENGSNFYPNADYFYGFPFIQGFMLLPLPGSTKKIVHIYGNIKVLILPDENNLGYIKLRYAIADMSENGGLGKVVQRDIVAGVDTLIVGQLTAVKHGNGRDWWIIAPHFREHKFYRYLLSPTGLAKDGEQSIEMHDWGLGQTVFSPDGQWYARFLWHGIVPDSSFSSFDLYHFDRCSGLFSAHKGKTFDLDGKNGKPGGMAFSPASRYLYVSRWDTIFQYDLMASDIIGTETVVAGYDGFTDEQGAPTRFYSLQLAPDNKIYCCVSNYSSRYLHRIEQPDEPGLACDVQQHSVYLPVYNNFLLPNMPFYRLGAWEDSPCDTLGSVGVKELTEGVGDFAVYPNPAQTEVVVTFSQPVLAETNVWIINGLGQVLAVHSIPAGSTTYVLPVVNYPVGFYAMSVLSPGQPPLHKSLIIAH
jgi:hypothetical protein